MTLLLCDYDGRLPGNLFFRLRMIGQVYDVRVKWVRIDRTRHGFHVVAALTGRMPFHRIVTLQSVLGSDWKRELYNSRRAVAWRNVPALWRRRANVLYSRHERRV